VTGSSQAQRCTTTIAAAAPMRGIQNGAKQQQSGIATRAAAAAAAKRGADAGGRHQQSSIRPAAPLPSAETAVKCADDAWVEVIHRETGQIYYWNQQTSWSPLLFLEKLSR
jgi:hypothetical protein